jgi:hypothetical protein
VTKTYTLRKRKKEERSAKTELKGKNVQHKLNRKNKNKLKKRMF